MHLRDSSTAQVMRRASTGPHALMMRRALQPYVPDRGSTFSGHPSRSRRPQYFGAVSTTASIASGVSRGMAVGSAVGSVVPIFGTAIGAIIGAAVGWADAAFNRQDPEVQNFNQATQMANAQGPESVVNIMNKYLVLAGLFDLHPSQIKGNIPIYKKYGRMGEGQFVTDMCNLVYNAAQAGQIGPNDTAQTVFARIVQPWIDSFGYGAMSDSNGETINYLIMGMLAEYFAGLNKRWFAVGGDYPFGGLPTFSLPQSVAPTSSATPSPVPVIAPPVPQTTAPPQPSELQRYLNGAIRQNGTSVGYALGPDGKFLSIPPGGLFMGRQSDGSWIVQYATGEYVLSGGQLVPYQTAAMVTGLPPASAAPSTPVTVLTPDPGYVTVTPPTAMQPATPQIQYVPSGGGGGGYYPTSAPSSVVAAPQGMSTQEMMLLGGGALLLVLLLTRKPAVGVMA
jgi:hypothetical protein